MNFKPLVRSPIALIFAALFGVGLVWSVYTHHVWEDYYITYRASKNLATGHGLTFTQGERVHSFTSPLGVLLPALSSLLTNNRSDSGALWIFRFMSIAAFAGAGVFLWRSVAAKFASRGVAVLLLVLVATDTKIVDFSTNGMETGFLLLFLAWTLYALLVMPARLSVHLGFSWAGLTWTRPDSFIYIAVLGLGALVFQPGPAAKRERLVLLRSFLAAGALTTILYLPWLLWAWSYYGTPLPHTIIAKGLFQPPTTVSSLWHALISFPRFAATHRDILTTTFMPPYSFNTGWPTIALQTSYWLSLVVMLAWILPGVRREARLASFAFFAGQFYLSNYVAFPVPWYLPTVTLFALIVITSVADQVLAWTHRSPKASRYNPVAAVVRRFTWIISGTLAAGALTVFVMAAHQLRWQQELIEEGQRREIGLWLKEQATDQNETVFLEPLGYIGFYSNLKMLDYPGLSSPEVVAARKRAGSRAYPDCWPELILDLMPNWVVLRSYEADAMRRQSPEVLSRFYSLARTFDVRAVVEAIGSIAGRGYLLNDAYFEVYRRNAAYGRPGRSLVGLRPLFAKDAEVNEGWGNPVYDSGMNLVAHAPSRLVFKLPLGARKITGEFGFFDGAYTDEQNSTDGAVFTVTFISSDKIRHELFHRALNPRDAAADRGGQPLSVEFPAEIDGSVELMISTGPHGSNAFDWTYWSSLLFEFPHDR